MAHSVFHACTKHVEIDYHFFREQVAAKRFQMAFISNMDQLADALTKPGGVRPQSPPRQDTTVPEEPTSALVQPPR